MCPFVASPSPASTVHIPVQSVNLPPASETTTATAAASQELSIGSAMASARPVATSKYPYPSPHMRRHLPDHHGLFACRFCIKCSWTPAEISKITRTEQALKYRSLCGYACRYAFTTALLVPRSTPNRGIGKFIEREYILRLAHPCHPFDSQRVLQKVVPPE